MAPTASVHAACVRLELSSRAENVPLVRQALGGLADAIGLSPADLNDIGTAVTEACTNASLHAYGGEEGPLEVELLADAGAIVALVRDRGVGLTFDTRAPVEFPTDVDGELAGIGVPSILSLATNARWVQPDGGGTEVEMTFSIRLKALESGVPATLLESANVEPVELRDAIEVAMAPLEVARGVLPRLLSAMAARAHFSVQRHADVQRIGSVALGTAGSWPASGSVQARVVAGVDFLELAIGSIAVEDYRPLADAVRRLEPGLHSSTVPFGDEQRLVLRLGR
jgi:anti-sigma regulatory factor (Ser/Thr protein kinase)